MTKINGGALLAQCLHRAGVTEVFTLHGGHLDAFLMACPDYGIRLTDTRHESTAGHAADAYARLSGKIGVCVITSGPGFTNAYSAIANSYLDSIPVLFVVSSPPLREQETNPLQGGFDQIACAAPITKWAHRVTNVERIPELVNLALRKATNSRPGPTVLEVPIDIMFTPVDDATVRMPLFPCGIPRPAPSTDDVRAVFDALNRAKRPVILTGGGALLSGCGAELREFAEACSIPVFSNKGEGLFPASHPLWGGHLLGLTMAPLVAGEPIDLVLVLGHRFGLMTSGRGGPVSSATIIQVDVDAAEIGRLHDVAVPIVADCRTTLAALNEAVGHTTPPDFSEWAKLAVTGRWQAQQMFPDEATPSGRLHPNVAARELLAATPHDAIVVYDGGETAAWASLYSAQDDPGSVIAFGYFGCLGTGQGFAIGAARARPEQPVLLVTGDGAAAFHVAEFDTMARHELAIVTAVFSNRSWGMSLHGQQIIYPDKPPIVSELPDSAFEQIAAAFGAHGARIDKREQITDAVTAAFGSHHPTCLNLIVDGQIVHPATTAMLADLDAENAIVVPYYENIPLDRR